MRLLRGCPQGDAIIAGYIFGETAAALRVDRVELFAGGSSVDTGTERVLLQAGRLTGLGQHQPEIEIGFEDLGLCRY